MFEEDTRAATQANLEGFGTALAGRGESINTAIGAFRPLLRDIQPVMRNLSSPETNLERLVVELGDAASIVAPAAEEQASLFRNIDTTMAALREVRPGVAALRTAAPVLSDALETGIEVLPNTPPLNRRLESLLQELQTFANDPLVPRGIRSTTQ